MVDMTWSAFFNLLISGLAMGAVYGLVALSYNLVYATRNIVNFAQGELVVLAMMLGVTLHVTQGLPLWVAFIMAAVVVALVSLLIEYLAVRVVGDVNNNFIWIMSTFGFGIALNQLVQKIWGTEPIGFPKWIGGNEPWRSGDLVVLPQEVGIIVIAVVATILLEVYRRSTLFGKAVRATSLDRSTAELMGIRTARVVASSYLMAGVFATLIGFLIAPVRFADPHAGIVLGIKGFIALVVGGLGSSVGGFLGGVFLGLLEVISSTVFSEVWKDVITFLVLIVVMAVRPQGFFTRWK
jgi:branched-chain amino acid transport system permease protein